MGIDANMYVVVPKERALEPLAIRKLAGELVEAFGHEHFYYLRCEGQHALRDFANKDGSFLGEDRRMTKDSQILYVSLTTRFYGPNYERGDAPFLICLGEWLEFRLPYGKVFYGGDSGGRETPMLFDGEARAALFQHFAVNGHTPYHATFGASRREGAPTCDFCGGRAMTDLGGGGSLGFFECYGCHWRVIVVSVGPHLGTIVADLRGDADFFNTKRANVNLNKLRAGGVLTPEDIVVEAKR